MDDWFDTLDAVFPYPYRGAAALFSKRYRARVRALYGAATRGQVIVDATLSGLFLLAQVVLLIGLPIKLIWP